MIRRTLSRPLCAALTLVLAPAIARATVPVSIYPLEAQGLSETEQSDLQAVIESAVRTGERRGALKLRTPALLPASCRIPPTDACLATLAKDGVVLVAKARQKSTAIAVTLAFVDAQGRRTRAVAFAFDAFLQDLRPAVQAVAMAEAELDVEKASAFLGQEPKERAPDRVTATAERPPPPAAAASEAASAPPPTPESATAAPSRPLVAEARPNLAPAEPTPLARSIEPEERAPEPVAGSWKRPVGKWASLAGVVLLAGGTTAGLLGKKLNSDLTSKYNSSSLTPADASSYDRLATYELLANGLLIAGGVVTAGGLTLWAIAPSEGGEEPKPRGLGVWGTF